MSFLQLPHGDEGRGRLVSHNARYDDDDGVDHNHDRHDEIKSVNKTSPKFDTKNIQYMTFQIIISGT